MRSVDNYGVESTTYYLGDYEYTVKKGGNTANHYINGVGGLSALYVIRNDEEATKGSIFYVAKDYLGSITALFDENSVIVNENSFDAWGRSRNPNKWSYDMRYKREMPLPELTTRGYTGHEHLNQFQLINMNGRLYDPITKQMSQPDILNVDPYSTQSYNRYSYCINNPLKYTDPSGYTYRLVRRGWYEYGTYVNGNEFAKVGGWNYTLVNMCSGTSADDHVIQGNVNEANGMPKGKTACGGGAGKSNPGKEAYSKYEEVAEDVSASVGLFTTMVSEAARGITAVLKVGNGATFIGAGLGAIDNAIQGGSAFSNGNYWEAGGQFLQAGAYVVGGAAALGGIFVGSSVLGVGAVTIGIGVLVINTGIDLFEYGYKNR